MNELDLDIQDNLDAVEIVSFDLESVESEAVDEAVTLVDNLAKFYYDEDFMRSHPSFKKRVDSDLESLRVVLKLRKADERVQDQLIKSIASNPNNASLYKALADIQKVIISLTTKMNEIVTGLNNLMRGYQQELNFDAPGTDSEQTNTGENTEMVMRGAKDFIREMKNNMERESDESED